MNDQAVAVDKSAARVRRMFGSIAPRYDLLNHLLSLGIDRTWRRRTVRLVCPQGEGPILDVCTGTADLALEWWRATREPTPVCAADFCRPMLDVAAEKIYRAGASHRVRLFEADAARLPFADDTFQIVSVAFGLRNVQDTAAGIGELVRVCRPGGRVAVLEFSMPHVWPFGALYRFYFRHLLPRVGQRLARNEDDAYRYLPASVAEFPEGDALVRRMMAAGLERVDVHPFTFGIATLYVGVKCEEKERAL